MNPSEDAAAQRYRLWYGRAESPPELRELRAGPLSVQLDGGDLRYLCLGDLEVVRRVYAAVRDPNWGTVAAALSNLEIEAAPDHFAVAFDGRHRQGAIDYTWRGTIVGAPDGTITYTMAGVANVAFRYNKIGLNIHHPIRQAAGQAYTATTPTGPISGRLPDTSGPQPIVDDIDVPLFPPFGSLTIDQQSMLVRFDVTGALAEMEDQRNWSDASFKTYMPPQLKGFPYQALAAQRFNHSITISLPGQRGPHHSRPARLAVDLGEPLGWPLPSIGLGMASHGGDLTARESDLLRTVRPDHLRADLRLADPAYREELGRAERVARALGCRLELALFLTDDALAELDALAEALRGLSVPVRRALVFHQREEATADHWIELVRARLTPVLPSLSCGGGTNANYCELNRNRPHTDTLDALAYSVNPQVHAFDELSLAEAVEAQGEGVRSAQAFAGRAAIVVSPVTLKPRFNAVATTSDLAGTSGGLPWEVDARQASLFGAAWTVGSMASLAGSGARAVTYYETTGWRGLIETETGSPLPDLFPSRPGMVFPLYHVLADLGDWSGARVIRATPSHPLIIAALVVRRDDATHVVVANLTERPRQVTVGPLPTGRVSVRQLDEQTARAAMFEPEAFRASYITLEVDHERLAVDLAPYATVWITAGGER